MKTKKQYLVGACPLPSEEMVFCRATASTGEHYLQPLRLGALLDGRPCDGLPATLADSEFTYRVLTWNGENFTWKNILSVTHVPSPNLCLGVQLTLASRTGFNRASLYLDTHVLVDTEVYDLTVALRDGVWRRASRLSSGRSVSSVSGPELPSNPALLQEWKGGSIHRATAQVVRSKQRTTPGRSVAISVEESDNVVLANGLIVRTAFREEEQVPQ